MVYLFKADIAPSDSRIIPRCRAACQSTCVVGGMGGHGAGDQLPERILRGILAARPLKIYDGYGWIWMDMDGYGWVWEAKNTTIWVNFFYAVASKP